MATLFSIEPIGVGTPEVESLPSYISRLAQAHGVTVGQLLKYVSRTCQQVALRSGGANGKEADFCHAMQLAEFVRPTTATKCLVDALNCCTGRSDLAWLTFLPLAGGLNRAVGAFSIRLKWCPMCLYEAKAVGSPAYYHLLWQVRDAQWCQIHHVRLEKRCPDCEKYQGTFRYRKCLNFCQECGASLSGTEGHGVTQQLELSCAADVARVLALYKDLPEHGVSGEAIRARVHDLFDWYWKREREDEIYRRVGRDRLLAVAVGDKPISLITVRRLAYELAISIYDLVAGDLGQLSLDLQEPGDNQTPPFMEKKRRQRHDRNHVLNRIMNVLDGAEEPLPLRTVARRSGVSSGYIRARFPSLVGRITDRRKKYQENSVQNTTRQAIAAILQYRASGHSDNPQQGEKKMIQALSQEYRISKYRLRKVWRDLKTRWNNEEREGIER